jgi:mRNA interferase RelE/StbE
MEFKVEIHRNVLKFLSGLSKQEKDRVIRKLRELSKNPFPRESLRIKGYKEKLYRIRVGDYRILYYVDENSFTIFIFKIDKRSRIYNRVE